MRSGRWRSRCGLMVAVALALGAGGAWAAPDGADAGAEGPIVFGSKDEKQLFSLENYGAALEALYRFQDDSIRNSDGTRSTFRQHHFEETANLWGQGAVVHPNLFEYKASATLGLTQDLTDQTDAGQDTFGTLLEYDFSGTFLRKQDAVFSVYTRQTRDLVSRQFAGTLEQTVMSHGARANFHAGPVPTELHLSMLTQSLKDSADSGGFDLTQYTFEWHSQWQPAAGHHLNWDYTLSSVEQSGGGDQTASYLAHQAALSHSVDLDAEARHNLYSSLSWYQQTGDSPLDRLAWSESLVLRHSAEFRTQYDLNVSRDQQPALTQTQYRGTAGFQHQLYQSLTTSGSVGARLLDLGGQGDSEDLFGNLDFDYRKKVPLGRLTAAVHLGYNRQRSQQRSAPITVPPQPFTFTDPLPVVLAGRNIVGSSIHITNAANTFTYTRDVHYTVTELADRVEIARIVGAVSEIPADTPVLIDYVLAAQPANTAATTAVGLSLRYDLQESILAGLGLYARWYRQEQSIDTATPEAFTPEQATDFTLGADYRVGDFFFSAERQWHDATIAPYQATRLAARFQHRAGRDTQLGAAATYTLLDYDTDGHQVSLVTVSASAEHRFTRDLTAGATFTWRSESDDRRGDTQGFDLRADVRWRHRQTEVFLQARGGFFDTPTSQEISTFVEFGVRREF